MWIGCVKRLIGRPQEALLCAKAKRQRQVFPVRKRSVSDKAPSRNGNQPHVQLTNSLFNIFKRLLKPFCCLSIILCNTVSFCKAYQAGIVLCDALDWQRVDTTGRPSQNPLVPLAHDCAFEQIDIVL